MKRIFWSLLTVCMLAAVMTVGTLAADVIDLDFTDATGDETGTNYSWDNENKILKIENFVYSTDNSVIITVPDETTIKVVGENQFTTTAASATALSIHGRVSIIGEGANAAFYAKGSINTPDSVLNAGLSLTNVDVNIDRNSVSIRNDNGTRGDTGTVGVASIQMNNSSLYCGPIFVGAHLSSNHSYTRTYSVFYMNNSSVDIQGGGKSAMIFAWGDCGVDFDIIDSNVKIWNSGWQECDINIQGGNDHYNVTNDSVILDVNIERSNLDMYGYWSGLQIKRYYDDSAKINFNMDESTVSTMTKYGSAGISIEDSTNNGTTTKNITDSITYLTNDPGHSGTDMEVRATIYGNPVIHKDFSIVNQIGGTNNFSEVDFTFALGDGQTLTINPGVVMTSAKAITMDINSKIIGDFRGEVIVPEGYISVRDENNFLVVYPEDKVHEISVTATPAECGTVTGSGEYIEGTKITLTATPIDGYEFAYWMENETIVSRRTTMTTYVDSERSIIAVFEKIVDESAGYGIFRQSLRLLFSQTYDIDVISTEGGTVTPKSGTNTVLYDRSITYTITPDEGYRIADVLYNGESVGAVTEYTAKRVKADGVLEVVFEMIPVEEETTEEPTPAEETEVA